MGVAGMGAVAWMVLAPPALCWSAVRYKLEDRALGGSAHSTPAVKGEIIAIYFAAAPVIFY
jgi:hypothetical protein